MKRAIIAPASRGAGCSPPALENTRTNMEKPAFQIIAGLEIAHVNLVVAVFIWVMIYPMMIQIDWHAVKDVGKKPRGLLLTLVVNWLIKPFTMAALGVLFFKHLFAPWVDPQSANEYIAGMILLGVAPCTAMVFVWSQLVKGDANYTLVQVSVNDLIMVFAFAPIAAFLLGVTNISVPWETLVLSTVLYVVLPLPPAWPRGMRWGAQFTRGGRLRGEAQAVVRRRPDRHRGAAVRLPGGDHRGPSRW
jgi:arsenical-resistance protein